MNDYTDPDLWWDEYARCYEDRSWNDARYAEQLALLQKEGLAPPVVDIGCGLGFLVEKARRSGLAATGLEASTRALLHARRRHPEADLREWRAGTPLPFADGSTGGAFLIEFIDHIPREQNEALFAELVRILRPGGLLLVQSPSRFNRFDHDLGHVDFFSPGEFRAFVTSRGFDVLRQPYTPQPLLGSGFPGSTILRVLSLAVRPERWAARIDLVARRR